MRIIMQPIICNSRQRVVSAEILPYHEMNSVGYNNGVLLVEEQLRCLSQKTKSSVFPQKININIGIDLVSDFGVLNLASKLYSSDREFSFTLVESANSYHEIVSISEALYSLKKMGFEIWVNSEMYNAIDCSLFDGVRFERSKLWRAQSNELSNEINKIKHDSKLVMVDGVDDEFYKELSRKIGADFSQGFYWGTLILHINEINH